MDKEGWGVMSLALVTAEESSRLSGQLFVQKNGGTDSLWMTLKVCSDRISGPDRMANALAYTSLTVSENAASACKSCLLSWGSDFLDSDLKALPKSGFSSRQRVNLQGSFQVVCENCSRSWSKSFLCYSEPENCRNLNFATEVTLQQPFKTQVRHHGTREIV